jgi:hypothetical protein
MKAGKEISKKIRNTVRRSRRNTAGRIVRREV